MRWNSGGTYPAIEHSVPSDVLIPNPGEEVIDQIGATLLNALYQIDEAFGLVESAKSDVENLINGSLDIEILTNKSDDIERWLKENPSPYAEE
jgi:hypothetical protein